ncbi:hypothetical protein IFM89_017147 [Coptis chinensis]|uniref:Uncharacterized protein n=1 Tax=Coptis chinensis TaxID=261450 RepID=A0A835ICE2_9MAGN|nr:hypothetical protein IFM89_017147 [Coptis chinensis]
MSTRKDQPSKKSRKADEANEVKALNPKLGITENNEMIDVPGEVQNLQNDVPRARRGKRADRAGRNLVPSENLQVPEARRGGRIGRAGGRRDAGQHVNLQPVIDVPELKPEPGENLQVPGSKERWKNR